MNLVRAGSPLPDVARITGHQTLAMVWRYAHHAPEDAAARARDRLESYLETAPKPGAAAVR